MAAAGMRAVVRPDRARMPPLAWTVAIVGGVLLIVMVALLSVQLAVLKDSQRHIASQDEKVTAAMRAAQPVLGRIEPAALSVRRQATTLMAAVGELPGLARTARAAAAVGIPVLSAIDPQLLAGVLGRANGVLGQASGVLDEVQRTQLVSAAARSARLAPHALSAEQQLIRIQLDTLRIQQRSLRTQAQTLAIQRQALAAIQDIDRKTGGPVPPALP